MNADEIIEKLGLQPHPEGGYYGETYRDQPADGGRGSGTAIYFLLKEGESSHWHKVDAAEIWHHYAGAPLELRLSSEPGKVRSVTVGSNLAEGELPQAIVQPGEWQAARTLGKFTLVGCTVSPAFEFSGFELAPPGWEP